MLDVVDAHLQVWNPGAVHYPWMTPEVAAVEREFRMTDVVDELAVEGVHKVVLVQSADNRADSEHMLFQALCSPRVAGVVTWVPLECPDDASSLLDTWRREPVVGVGHRVHEEADPQWLLRPSVDEGLTMLAERHLTLDLTTDTPQLLEQLSVVAERHPKLTFVVDHLGRPPLAALRTGARDAWTRWSALLGTVAQLPNVVAKLSGLNTAAGAGWTTEHLQRAVDRALELFSPDRLMLGSNWPYALLAGDSYSHVWHGLRRTVDALPEAERALVLGGTANRVYGLPLDAD